MRLHLWQRLFLAFALLSGLALLGFAAWQQHSFRRGFLSYLDQVSLQRLTPAASRLAAAYVEHGGWDWLRADPGRFGEYIEGREERQPEGAPPREQRESPGDAAPPREQREPPGNAALPAPEPPPPAAEPPRGALHATRDQPPPPQDFGRPPRPGGPPAWSDNGSRPPPPGDRRPGDPRFGGPPRPGEGPSRRPGDGPPRPGEPRPDAGPQPPPRAGDAPPPLRSGAAPAAEDAAPRGLVPPPHLELRTEGEDRPDQAPAPRAPPPRPPRPRGPPDLMPRLSLVDLADEPVAGNPHVPATAAALPIMAQGQRVGSLRLAPMPQLSGATDLAFAQAQANSALVAAAAILLGALLLAFTLARWLLAPVHALAAGTRALAAGDFARRIGSARRDELGELSRDFDHLAATLEQHRDARRQWGADIAHELRTPLSILRGEIQALQDGVRQATPQALESLQAECVRLGTLIDDLYQLSLADAGALEYRFDTLDFSALVEEGAELQRPATSDAGLALEARVAPGVRVRGDARRLGQLLDNLLVNARRYTQAPGRIRITLASVGRQVRLVVEDTPPGVPPDALPHLFERLYRVEASRSRAAGGAGLGLAICRAIVTAHEGRIVAEHSPLGGLRVTVELPLGAA